MPAQTRSLTEREHDLQDTLRWYLEGKTQAEIAKVIGVSREQIKYDLATIRERWRNNTTFNLDEAKQGELARIDHLERTYWEGWALSLQEKVDTRQEQLTFTTEEVASKGKKPKRFENKHTKGVIERKQMIGNAAMLQGVQWCISERCRILGLYAPTNLTVDWRQEAALLGLDADTVFEQFTKQLVTLVPSGPESTVYRSIDDDSATEPAAD